MGEDNDDVETLQMFCEGRRILQIVLGATPLDKKQK